MTHAAGSTLKQAGRQVGNDLGSPGRKQPMALTQISPVLLSAGTAEKAIDAAIERVQEIGVPYTITVLDGAGLLVAARRMDGAAIASIDTSLAKARTAVYFGAATADLAPMVASGAAMMTVQT